MRSTSSAVVRLREDDSQLTAREINCVAQVLFTVVLYSRDFLNRALHIDEYVLYEYVLQIHLSAASIIHAFAKFFMNLHTQKVIRKWQNI